MKMTYKVERDENKKIFARGFLIENATVTELDNVAAMIETEYEKTIVYDGKIYVPYSPDCETLAQFKENVKRLYNDAKDEKKVNTAIKKQAEKWACQAVPVSHTKKPVYIAKNTKKKKQRRIIQINKALDILGEKCTLYTAIHCLSYVKEKKHRNGYFMDYVA